MTNPLIEKKTWSIPEAFLYCERVAKSHYENFPVGSWLIPKKLRPYVWAIYAFARKADDYADEDYAEKDRLPKLDRWQDMLLHCYHRRVNHPVFLALGELVRQFKIPQHLFVDLITAFKMDVIKKRHATFEELLYYFKHSANPVGRLILHLFNVKEPRAYLLSDYVCTALQLANFWQDVSVDLEKDRIYIPQEDFAQFQYTEKQLVNRELNIQFQRLMAFQIQRTKRLFRKAEGLPALVGGRLGFELRAVILGGMGILKAVEAVQYDTLHTRPALTKGQKLKILLKACFRFKRSLAKPLVAVRKPESA